MIIAYSFGVIDFLHYGHIRALKEAKAHSDVHYFGLIEDEASRDWMGSLLSDYNERKNVLEQVACIDHVIPQRTLDPLENLQWLHETYPEAQIALYYGSTWKTLSALNYLQSIDGLLIRTPYYEKFKPEHVLELLTERTEAPRARNELLSTKANTLLALQCQLSRSRIEDILIIRGADYTAAPSAVCAGIAARFGRNKIVLRSSSSNEDCFATSNAGHYESVLNIFPEDAAAVTGAIDAIFASYARDGLDISDEQILIQTQTQNVAYSGVVFTRDINQNRPYYVINYDDTGSTEYVTGGSGGKTLYVAHDYVASELPAHWQRLLFSVQEIEALLSDSVLDIEFALTHDGQVVIFQTRPLAACYKYSKHSDDEGFFALKTRLRAEYEALRNAVDGGPMFLSDMAFWNPAEIIGANPHPLDYSLYRTIITRRAWNEGLVPMGYWNVPQELMYRVANKPYISLEYSFLSLIPATLEAPLAHKLVAYYRDKLKRDLSAHDKIEFEIVVSCYDLESEEKLAALLSYGFSQEEVKTIRDAVWTLTHEALLRYDEVLLADKRDLDTMLRAQARVEARLREAGESKRELLFAFRALLRSLCAYGTPQFSRQARYAFLCRAICKTMVSKGYCTAAQMDAFMRTVRTVATDFSDDFAAFRAGHMPSGTFYAKYGHLRSGTYDICSPRYDAMRFSAMEGAQDAEAEVRDEGAPLDAAMLRRALDELGFSDISPEMFMRIARAGFEQRELFKFEFTKSLSLAIELLARLGESMGLSRRELSYLDVADVLSASNYPDGEETRAFFKTIIGYRAQQYKKNMAPVLPEVLCDGGDLDVICMGAARPNFITNSIAEGDVTVLESGAAQDVSGKVVVIEKADPGYDWIFANNICGLITKYGGAASHMAIRCAEFGVPAAIGCGSRIFEYVCGLKRVCIDCKNQTIEERIGL